MALTEHIQCELSINDATGILGLKPDLMMLYKGNFHGYETLLPALDEASISFLFVEVPMNFDDMMDSLTMLGEVVGAQERAAQMVLDVETSLSQLAQIISSIPEDERIRVSDYHDYAPYALYDVIAHAAGVISDGGSIFVQRHYDYLDIDDQLLSEWNPDLITFPPFATDTDGTLLYWGKEYVDDHAAYLLEKPSLSAVSAIKNGNVHPLSLNNSQYMVQSAMDLARLAYPDLFDKQAN